MDYRAFLLLLFTLPTWAQTPTSPQIIIIGSNDKLLDPPISQALEEAQAFTRQERERRGKILSAIPSEESKTEILALIQELADRKPNTPAALEMLSIRVQTLEAQRIFRLQQNKGVETPDTIQFAADLRKAREALEEGASRMALRPKFLRILETLQNQPEVNWSTLNFLWGQFHGLASRGPDRTKADAEALDKAMLILMAEWMLRRTTAEPAPEPQAAAPRQQQEKQQDLTGAAR